MTSRGLPRCLREKETVVRDFGEPVARLASRTRCRARAARRSATVRQRRIAERGGEQVVHAAARWVGRLRAVDHFLEKDLLFGRVDELSGGHLMLRFDRAPRPSRERTELRVARASRPDTGRHRRVPPRSGSAPPERRPGGRFRRAARLAPWRRRRRRAHRARDRGGGTGVSSPSLLSGSSPRPGWRRDTDASLDPMIAARCRLRSPSRPAADITAPASTLAAWGCWTRDGAVIASAS